MDVVQHAENWMTAHPAGPHFVWVHLYDPHDPYEPPSPYSETYKDRLYDGEIAYADSALGQFVAFLKKNGRYDNSLIVVVGDHGEGLGEHHENTHGIFLYDSTTHVPLIVKLPGGSDSGKVIQAQVRTTDILPTVTDWVHVAPPQRLDGESLRPYFGAEGKDRIAFGETDYPLRFGWAPLRSVRADGFKFIEAPRPELYDLHADPGELTNRYRPTDSQVRQFRSMLAEVGAKAPQQPSANDAGAPTQAARDQLKALGYQAHSDASGTGTEASSLPDPKDKIEEQNLLHTAMMASDDNRSGEARHALEEVLRLDPKSPTALRQLGELELQAGDYTKAAEHLKQAREVRPEDATAAFYEGQARQKTGDLAGARDALEASLKLTPGQFPARLLLGQVYLGLKDPNNAEDQFEAALLLEPKSSEAQTGLTQAQQLQKPAH
jgi:Flp pilus assembly protein TadD